MINLNRFNRSYSKILINNNKNKINQLFTTTTKSNKNNNNNEDINNNNNNNNNNEISDNIPYIKPRINFQYIKDNFNNIKDNIIKRKSNIDLELLIKSYDEYRIIKKELDYKRSKRNEIASQMKSLLKNSPQQDRIQLVEQGKTIKEELITLEKQHDKLFNYITLESLKIPNNTHQDAPIGPESNARVIQLVNDKPNFKENQRVKDHLELGEECGLIKSASKTTGHKYYYFTREAAMMEMALSFWAFSKLSHKYGFTSVITPDLIHPNLAEGCGFHARSDADQLFWIKDRELCLSATSEIPLAGMYSHNEPIDQNDLPIKMVGYSHCFRPEVGKGTQNRGIYRVHQFSKVEMFIISTPEQSNEILEDILKIQLELFTELGLHFRVLDMPTEDLGAPAFRKYDIEVWIPSKNDYGEISSASNCTNYQSKRLNIKYTLNNNNNNNNNINQDINNNNNNNNDNNNNDDNNNNNNNNLDINNNNDNNNNNNDINNYNVIPSTSENSNQIYAHTLNGTACAIPRLILAILENNQQPDGSILIPKVLRPYMNNQEYIYPLKKNK